MKEVLKKLLETYAHDSEVCMAEFLANEKVSDYGDMTFEQVFETYVKAMNLIEDDEFFVKKEDELIKLS